jgi:hypothetical protein
MSRRRLTIPNEEAVLREARAMVARGETMHSVASKFGVTAPWLRRRLDPEYAKRYDKLTAERRTAKRVGRPGRSRPKTYYAPISEDELAERRALIPVDTRDLTARLMGDPIPNDPRRLQAQG